MKIEHPYEGIKSEQWLRGNLHAHTTRSDGKRSPQTVLDDYAARGYDFLMISDHDIYTSTEDHTAWDARGMLLIPGNEVTRNGPHLLHVDADRLIEPEANRQSVLHAITGAKGFSIINHPDWRPGFNHCTLAQLQEWQGYQGIEIYNGVIARLNGSPYALLKWESLLAEGRRVWGYANDDSHDVQDVALGWNVVSVPERTASAVVEALRLGRFYASTGVEITDIQVEGSHIRLETTNAERIIATSEWGHRFAVADAASIEVDVPENAPYVRFECWGRGEQFAWTQPFFVV